MAFKDRLSSCFERAVVPELALQGIPTGRATGVHPIPPGRYDRADASRADTWFQHGPGVLESAVVGKVSVDRTASGPWTTP